MGARTAAVVTASDGVASGTRADGSGEAVAELLHRHGFEVVTREAVADDAAAIAEALVRLSDDDAIALVAVTGGTGLGPRDVTPEATRTVIDREVPGMAEAMRAVGRASTPMADLSRGIVGLRGSTLILNLPGSPRGATESLDAVIGLVPHALDLAAGQTRQHPSGHGEEGTPTTARAHDHGHEHASDAEHDPGCAVAHGDRPADADAGTIVAVYATGVAEFLLHWGRELGYRTVLVEPDDGRVTAGHRRHADTVTADVTSVVDDQTDVVVTDHHAGDLADQLTALLGTDARYIGLMGSPRHEPPHVGPLTERGFTPEQIGRVQRPIGLDIGSHTPAEIALSTLAGLVAGRKGRTGGFHTTPA